MTTLLLHGMTNSGRAFDRLVPLVDAPLVLDLPGHGSFAGADGVETIEAMADAVAATLTEPVVACGQSMGGLVACALVERHPSLVTRLVLVNTPPTVASRRTANSGAERLLRRPVLGPALWRIVPASRVRAGMASAFAPGFAVPDVFVEDARRLTWRTFARSTAAVDAYVAATPLHERVAALTIPVTVVFGELDQRIALSSLDAYGAGVEVVRIPDAGHTPQWERPEAVAAAL